MVKAKGFRFINAGEIEELTKTEEGKKKIENMMYRPIRWHVQNNLSDNPMMNKSRYERRHPVRSPLHGFMKNNQQDRTKKKAF